MVGSLGRLLHHCIDYAGTFPPASLSLDESLHNYLKYRSGFEGPYVNRFVCACSDLPQLATLLFQTRPKNAVAVSAIGRQTLGVDDWAQAREIEATELNDFANSAEGLATIAAFEARIPSTQGVERYFDDLRGFDSSDVFVELPWDEQMSDTLAAAVDCEWLMVKARAASEMDSALPNPQQFSAFLAECLSLEVPFKLTAGLHHAITAVDPVSEILHYGLVNVITASVLGFSEDLSPAEISRILKCDQPSAWAFSDTSLTWREVSAGCKEIEQARELFLSCGTCSVSEPLEELKALGWV